MGPFLQGDDITSESVVWYLVKNELYVVTIEVNRGISLFMGSD